MDIEYVQYDSITENNYSAKVVHCYLDENGDFDPEVNGWESVRGIAEAIKTITDTAADAMDIAKDAATTVADFIKDAIGTGIAFVMNILGKMGDGVQWLANTIQTTESNDVLYSYEELESNTDDKDQYTKVSKSDSKNKSSTKKNQVVINLAKDEDGNGNDDFSEKTEIPVMVGDVYNIAVNHIDFFDINFLTGSNSKRADNVEKHQKGSAWLFFRNWASMFIHISIYITGAFLIISLIWAGIQIARHSLDDPGTVAEYKKKLIKFAKGVGLLISTILIMGIAIFGTEAFYSTLEIPGTYELPIRVNVEDTYSFSTTPTGYVRYISLTTDVRNSLKKTTCTFVYLILTHINLFMVIVMFFRMFILWGLAVIGPILVGLYVLGIDSPFTFGRWARLYIETSLIQIFVAIVYMIILKMAV